MRIQDLVELGKQNGINVPWDVQRKTQDVVKFFKERGVSITGESLLSRDEMKREAKRLGVSNQSLLRTKDALQKAIERAKQRGPVKKVPTRFSSRKKKPALPPARSSHWLPPCETRSFASPCKTFFAGQKNT